MKYRVKITEAPEIFKVRVTEPPKAKTGYQVEGSLANDLSAFGGGNLKLTEPKAVSRTTITKVPRDEANLEAEGGETVLTFDPSGYPLFYEIKGPRHSANGVPLNLPDDSFIFSDTKEMMIKDPAILKMFNKAAKKGGYTPADLSKQFISLNKYRATMQDPSSDKVQIKTAELMIKKMIIKLGALALAQESKKGFPQGIPAVAKQYMEANAISEQDILPDEPEQESPAQADQAIDMGQAMAEGAPQQAMEANEPPMMPDGSPVAMPQEMQGMPPQPGMRYGGRMLSRANKGLEVTLNKITQRVNAAIESGAELEDILLDLLQNRVTPEDLITVLGNLAIPEMKAKELVTDALNNLQQQAMQQQQMMAQQQQGMQGSPQGQSQMSPEQMMAMAQQMPQEQMQQAPMAMYGMSMGGYGMPFYNNPNEMAYGGIPKFNGTGNSQVKEDPGKPVITTTKSSAAITDSKRLGTEYAKGTYKPGQKQAGQTYYDVEGQKNIKGRGFVEGENKKVDFSKVVKGNWNPTIDEAAAQYCKNMKNPKSTDFYGVSYVDIANANFHYLRDSPKAEDRQKFEEIKALLKSCQVAGAVENFEFVTEEEKEKNCECLDEKGVPIEGKFAQKDENGNCLPETCNEKVVEEEECVCIDPATGQESVFPKNADGTCPPCEAYEMETVQQPQAVGMQYLPEDKLNLGIALGQRYTNVPPVMGKAPGVREQAERVDYIAQAELMKGMTQGTQNAIAKTAANNPGGAIAAMMAAQRGSQGDLINLASQVNAQNADRATALNKANTQHQWNQLLLDKDASDIYNQRNATWQSNKAQDYNNYWANVGDKFATMKGNARALAATNAAQGMKWNIDPVTGEEYYVNTNNKVITPEKPAEDFATKMARFKSMGITDNSDVLRAMDLERKMNISRYGGPAYKKGGYIYADMLWPFLM